MIEHYTVFKLRGYNSTTTPIRHLGTLGCYPWFQFCIAVATLSDSTNQYISETERTARYKIYTQTLPLGEVPMPPDVYFIPVSGGPTIASKGIK